MIYGLCNCAILKEQCKRMKESFILKYEKGKNNNNNNQYPSNDFTCNWCNIQVLHLTEKWYNINIKIMKVWNDKWPKSDSKLMISKVKVST